MPTFLKIGSRLVNLDSVKEIDLESPCSISQPPCVLFRFGDEYDTTSFVGDDAEAIREHFNNGKEVVDITPIAALEDSPL